MTVRILVGDDEPDDMPEWQLWTPDYLLPGYKANFYSTTEPYLRRHVGTTSMDMTAEIEERERANGFVPLNELPDHIIEYWARSDALWLADSINAHLERRGR